MKALKLKSTGEWLEYYFDKGVFEITGLPTILYDSDTIETLSNEWPDGHIILFDRERKPRKIDWEKDIELVEVIVAEVRETE